MPTNAQITSASPTLSAITQAQLLTLIRGSSRYQSQSSVYFDLAMKIAEASGNVKGQQLNAALTLIDAIGDGTVAVKAGGTDGTDYSQERDRNALINYVIDVLYDQPVVVASSVVVGQRGQSSLAWCFRHGTVLVSCGCRC